MDFLSDFLFPHIDQHLNYDELQYQHIPEDLHFDSGYNSPFKSPQNSHIVKLHYEKYSPHYSDDLKELGVFLGDILPILNTDHVKSNADLPSTTFPPDDQTLYSPPAAALKPEPPTLVDTDHRLHDSHYVSPLDEPVHHHHDHDEPVLLTHDHKQREYDERQLSPNNKLFAGLLPHAINIQINIPPSDDRKYKETDSYRQEKHITVTERPGYKSALGEEYGLPPKLPSYNPTVTPALPHYSTTPHLLPHHYQAKEYPAYDVPTPASIELPHTPHHLISEFRPPHADYLGEASSIFLQGHPEKIILIICSFGTF